MRGKRARTRQEHIENEKRHDRNMYGRRNDNVKVQDDEKDRATSTPEQEDVHTGKDTIRTGQGKKMSRSKIEKDGTMSTPEQEDLGHKPPISIVPGKITDVLLPQLLRHNTLASRAIPPDIPKCSLGQTGGRRQVVASRANEVNSE